MATKNIIVERNVPATMRDGTTLYADIYRPEKEGTYPILLTRIPYGKHDPFYSHRYLDTHRFVDHGYIVIIQDVRGRFASEGTFSMFTNEAKDGYDTIEWAAHLPYSNGNVGMFGLSYYGYTQLLAATEKAPHLKAIFPAQTLNDSRSGATYQNGAFLVGLFQSLILGTFVPDLLKRTYKDDLATYYRMMQKWAQEVDQIEKWYETKPIKDWSILKEFGLEGDFLDMITHELDDEAFWETYSLLEKYPNIQVPAYHLAGWYDCFLYSTIENFKNMRAKTDYMQKLVIGPWAHGNFGHVIGDRSFGMSASEHFIDLKEDLTALHIRWFDHWLKNEDKGFAEEAAVKIFTMGVNQWQEADEWPLPNTNYTPFYLHSNGKANTRFGDGHLTTEKPENDEKHVDQFVYDPTNPVPTTGGGTLYEGVAVEGPYDQRTVEEREDVLVYTSDVLDAPLEVTGPVSVKLWAKTDAKDTDFTAKLVDVAPDGTAYNLTDGIIRARYRHGNEKAGDVDGEIIPYEINLWATSNVFKRGHRIRVEISSSNFPRFDVNPNTGETVIHSDDMQTATQTIYHNETYPSHIMLPVIPNVK